MGGGGGDRGFFDDQVGEVFARYLRSLYQNGHPVSMPWASKRVVGKTPFICGGDVTGASGGGTAGGLYVEAYWCSNYD